MRYFFHTENGQVVIDQTGVELSDDTAARREAVVFLAEMLRDHAVHLWSEERFSVRIVDAGGRAIGEVTARAAASPLDRTVSE